MIFLALVLFLYLLERIYFDAAGLLNDQPEQVSLSRQDYSMIEGYRVADYKEQPHTYNEDGHKLTEL